MVITVTGSSGTIGSELVRLLSERGVPTRAIVRRLAAVHTVPNVAWLQADLSDARVAEPAIAGTQRLFLLTDNQLGFAKLQIAIVKVAEGLGVSHVVKLSALGASDHSRSWIAREHREVEDALRASRMTWTLLRPHAFMQNWLTDVAESVRTEGVIYSPIADGRVPFIDTRDIAAVAAEALLHPERYTNTRHVLTGGEAVGFTDVATALSQAIGRPVAYHPISMEDARARMAARGLRADAIEAALAIAEYQRAGGPTSIVSDQVERILGRPPRRVGDFARDYAERFR